MPGPSAHDIRLMMAMGYQPTPEQMAILNQEGGATPPTTGGGSAPAPSPTPTPGGGTTPPPTTGGGTPAPAVPTRYDYTGSGSNISDYAGGYMSFLADNPQYVVNALTPYINQETGTINISDINNALHSVQDWTGSGRQGAGRYNMQDLVFDANGNPVMYSMAPPTVDESGNLGSNQYNFTPSSTLQDLYAGDSMPWATRDTLEASGYYNQDPRTRTTYRNWQDLNPREQQTLMNAGIFNLDDPRAQFILTDQNDPQWNQYFSGVDVQNGQVNVQDLETLLRGGLSRQFDALGNTSQAPSEGWLFENPQVMLQMLGYAIPGAAPFLGLAGNVMNVGQGIESGNWTQAALGGFNLYNSAANMANTGAASYNAGIDQPGSTWYNQQYGNNGTVPGQDMYANYTPGSLVGSATGNVLPDWANGAFGNAIVAGATGGDPLYYAGQSLVGSAGDYLMGQLGLQPGDLLYGLGQSGLGYLYGDAYNNWQTGGGGGGSGGGTGGGTTPPPNTGGGGTTTPLPPWDPVNPPSYNYTPPTTQYTPPQSPYGQIPGSSSGGDYGGAPGYGTSETYGGDSAQDPGNPYNWSKPETVYG